MLWDLNAVKWYNPPKNTEYSPNVWNKVVPGYSVDIYEWVESTLLPEEWDAIADTTEGLSQGVSGSSKYGNTNYVRKNVYDPITGLFFLFLLGKKFKSGSLYLKTEQLVQTLLHSY